MAAGCSGWELEELFVRAIRSDTTAQHHVRWKEGGHDREADIRVKVDGTEYPIQIKSGQIKRIRSMGCMALVLSGYRLTRFKRDFGEMTKFLNGLPAHLIAMPCDKKDDDSGRTFVYKIAYIDKSVLIGTHPDSWKKDGARWLQKTEKGVLLSLTENMSWQVWWHIPLHHVEFTADIRID